MEAKMPGAASGRLEYNGVLIVPVYSMVQQGLIYGAGPGAGDHHLLMSVKCMHKGRSR